jgi:hypothetical protein
MNPYRSDRDLRQLLRHRRPPRQATELPVDIMGSQRLSWRAPIYAQS